MNKLIANTFYIATNTFFLSDWENPLTAKVFTIEYLNNLKCRPRLVQIVSDFGMYGNFSRN